MFPNANMFLFALICYTTVWISVLSKNWEVTEYCAQTTFNPSCSHGEVIVMQYALYGMIKVGNCVDAYFESVIGCVSDEISTFDQKCSGLQSCEVDIPDTEINKRLPCLRKGFSPYLEASYSCQKVVEESRQCTSPKLVKAISTDNFLSSSVSLQFSCGLQNTPYVLEAKPGQQINISLLDFSWKKANDKLSSDQDEQQCETYGYILDTQSDDVISLCGETNREKFVYTSATHKVQVLFETSAVQTHRFLIRYKAIGCPDIIPPNHGWIQRDEASITVGCYATKHTWVVKCIDTSWLGYTGNCTPVVQTTDVLLQPVLPSKRPITSSDQNNRSNITISTNHILIVVIGCVTLIFCCVVIILGIYCMRRYQRKALRQSSTTYPPSEYTYTMATSAAYPLDPRNNTVNQETLLMLPSYTMSMPKSGIPPEVPKRNALQSSNPFANEGNQNHVIDDPNSVQYYVLENPADSNNYENTNGNFG